MHIEKRSLGKFILLDILTFGIYGIIALHKMGDDINALCKGDGNKPRFGYGMVWFLPLLGSIGSALCALVAYLLFLGGMALLGTGSIFATLLAIILLTAGAGVVMCAAVGIIAPVAYRRFWWYEQNNRMKLNAGRYNIEVRESGLSVMAWQVIGRIATVGTVLAVQFVLSFIFPIASHTTDLVSKVWYYGSASSAELNVFALIVTIIISGFFITAALNISKYISTAFMMKNLNRLAEASKMGGARFDPMGYVYYDADKNFIANQQRSFDVQVKDEAGKDEVAPPRITCVHGALSGYTFDITRGEELVIGKDAAYANIVIDPAYKEVSRKHCGIRFDANNNSYRVTDYSSNGTFVGGTRLTKGAETTLSRGTEISLANGKNIFRLD